MEYREPPRIAAAEGRVEGADSPSRFRRFEFVRSERRLDLPRIALTVLALLVILGSLFYLGSNAIRAAVRWLHRQPEYQVQFTEIELINPLPPWFRGGVPAFLEQVRVNAREPEVLPVLDLQADRISRAFRLFPWVASVNRVLYPPGKIRVDLTYNIPVAMITFPPGEQFILDEKGHLLPLEDIDTERLGPLIKITGEGLTPPTESRPGLTWKSGGTDPKAARIDRCVLDAARLAGFLRNETRLQQAADTPALQTLAIIATDPVGRGLFLLNRENTFILWGDPPGDEGPGNLSAEDKWEILRKWAKTTPQRSLPRHDFWEFYRSSLKHSGPGSLKPN